MYSGYLKPVINASSRKEVIDRARRNIRKERFDTIAVRGISGISIGAILAHQLKKELAIVRKENDSHHTERMVESPFEVARYVIVDDFTSSGETLYHILRNMQISHPNALCLGYLAYKREGGLKDMNWVNRCVKDFIQRNPELAVLEGKAPIKKIIEKV
jgi:orotate phosphoribosyltransferase